jgi:hypothetical protein
MFLAAYRRDDSEALEGYRILLQEARVNLQAGRERIQLHQKSHNCSEAIRFGEDFERNRPVNLIGLSRCAGGHGIPEVSQLHDQGGAFQA